MIWIWMVRILQTMLISVQLLILMPLQKNRNLQQQKSCSKQQFANFLSGTTFYKKKISHHQLKFINHDPDSRPKICKKVVRSKSLENSKVCFAVCRFLKHGLTSLWLAISYNINLRWVCRTPWKGVLCVGWTEFRDRSIRIPIFSQGTKSMITQRHTRETKTISSRTTMPSFSLLLQGAE